MKPRTSLPLLTTSASKCYRTCNRLYFHAYEQGYRLAFDDPTREFGTIGHYGQEAWWNTRKDYPEDHGAALEAALASIQANTRDEFETARLSALAIGYHARWVDSPLVPLAVEKQYVTTLTNPATGAPSRTWRHAGKIDVIVRDQRDETWVLDHKYTSMSFEPGSDYRTALQIDHQVSNYLQGARSLGFEPRGWIHDVIKKPQQRPLKATAEVKMTQAKYNKDGSLKEASRPRAGQRMEDETPQEFLERIATAIAEEPEGYFARIEVVRMQEEEREAAFDLWQTGIQIRESRNANMWPRNPQSCKQYGRGCDFLPVCVGQASLDDGTRYRRAERPHEELEEAEENETEKQGEAA